jgi:Protein of unknown function (DUF3987)
MNDLSGEFLDRRERVESFEDYEARTVPFAPFVQAPRPLIMRPPPLPYPIDALGDLLAAAAQAIATKVQCAPAMAAQSVLAVGSPAAQPLADIRLPYGQQRPLTLHCLTIAASGDRKSSADNEAMVPVRVREKQLREQYGPIAKGHEVDLAAWRAQRSQIERAKSDLDVRRADLAALGPEPDAPLKPILTIGESTAEGLAKQMPFLPGSLGIFSAEGGQFLSGHGFTAEAKLRTSATFSVLWDGGGIRRVRAGDGLIDLYGRRVSFHLMIQPEAAAAVLGDPVLRDQGFLSRLLIAAPETNAGGRLWREPGNGTEPALRRYEQRIREILRINWPAANSRGNELTPSVLALSPEARAVWILFHDEVERAMGNEGRLADLRDIAGKSAEQAARIAGVLSIIEDSSASEIDGDLMTRGCKLARWYLDEALRMAESVRVSPEVRDAQTLLDWIKGRGFERVTSTVLLKSGPNALRIKSRLDPAIDVLTDSCWLVADNRRDVPFEWSPKNRRNRKNRDALGAEPMAETAETARTAIVLEAESLITHSSSKLFYSCFGGNSGSCDWPPRLRFLRFWRLLCRAPRAIVGCKPRYVSSHRRHPFAAHRNERPPQDLTRVFEQQVRGRPVILKFGEGSWPPKRPNRSSARSLHGLSRTVTRTPPAHTVATGSGIQFEARAIGYSVCPAVAVATVCRAWFLHNGAEQHKAVLRRFRMGAAHAALRTALGHRRGRLGQPDTSSPNRRSPNRIVGSQPSRGAGFNSDHVRRLATAQPPTWRFSARG